MQVYSTAAVAFPNKSAVNDLYSIDALTYIVKPVFEFTFYLNATIC